MYPTIECVGSLSFTFYVAAQISPWVLCSIPLVAPFLIYFARYYMKAYREIVRIEATTSSPVISHFGETLSGVSTIRAYKKQTYYSEQNYNKMDTNMCAQYWFQALNRWFSIRLTFISIIITASAMILAVVFRSSMD